jgi:hypothetical protein
MRYKTENTIARAPQFPNSMSINLNGSNVFQRLWEIEESEWPTNGLTFKHADQLFDGVGP